MHSAAHFTTERLGVLDGNSTVCRETNMRDCERTTKFLSLNEFNPLARTRALRVFEDAGIFFIIEGDAPSVFVFRSLAAMLRKDAER